jgi:PAS domain S-box-containing protein
MKSNKKPTYQDLEKLIIELKSEKKLNQIKDRFNLLLEASEDMITIHSIKGEYLYYNGPTCYAINPKDLVGKMPNDLFDKNIADSLVHAFKKVVKTGQSETIEVLLDWLGEKKWFSEYIYPIKNDSGKVLELVKVCRDIHQRKIAEQEIENKNKILTQNKKELDLKNEKLYELNNALNQAQKLSHVGNWYWNMAADKVEWSNEMYNIYGVTRGSFYPSYENVFKTILPEDMYKVEQSISSLLNNNTFVPFEYRISRPSGEIRDLYIIALEQKSDGVIFGVTKDITEQKTIELKNLILEKEYKQIFNNAAISIWNEDFTLTFEQINKLRELDIPDIKTYLDKNPKVTKSLLKSVEVRNVNKATLNLFKAKSYKHFLDNIHTTFGEGAQKVFRKLMESIWNYDKTFESEISYKTLYGDEFKAVISIPIPQTKMEQKTVPVSIQSIQKIKDAKSLIKESLDKLNEAQRLAKIGSWIFSPETQESEWSNEMFHIWGFDLQEPIPNLDSVANRVHKDDLDLFNNTLTKAIDLGNPFEVEYKICLPNNEEKFVKVICQPILDKNDKVVTLKGVTQDITDQKQLEKIQYNNQRLKAIGEMSSSIAHDFNNSLQQMMGNLEIVKFQKDLSESTLERLNNIEKTITDTASRVSALQTYGDTEHKDESTKLTDINTLIEESLKQSRPIWKDDIEKKGLNINVITDFEDIPKISCNNGELKSAIYNIVKNSIEAMPKGGELIIKTRIKPQGISVTFSDTGIGMDEETKLKVFDPFYSTKGFKLGRGLGMSGVFSIVKKHKGDIVIQSSELGKGTTIEIIFPISKQIEIKESSKTVSENKESYRVLWVDDDKMITESANDILELLGHNCNVENSGKNALKYLDKNTCDIVFTDIGMPEMNGWQLAEAIRNKFGKKIKIVIVSGWDVEEKTQKEKGIDFVLQKPFTVSELEDILMFE